jgi:DHHC palmitoyltransferase
MERKALEMPMAITLGSAGAGNAKRLSLLEPTIAKPAAGRSEFTGIHDRLLMSQSCIPKMDHHCPWTSNCVSHFTFPHFIRFLFYAVVAMTYLEYFLFVRCAVLWNKRNQPSVSLFSQIYI